MSQRCCVFAGFALAARATADARASSLRVVAAVALAGGRAVASARTSHLRVAAAVALGARAAAGATTFEGFVPDDDTMTCSSDAHLNPWVEKIYGVNLGSLFVLEPWITPSLFYQFLGGDANSTAMDTASFCRVLGPKEANKQLRRHWDTWVTEEHVARLAATGINSLRLPIGDYQFKAYGSYAGGCFEGSLEYVDRVLDWADKYGLQVLLDIHAVRGSQNGFDNSGETMDLRWGSTVVGGRAAFALLMRGGAAAMIECWIAAALRRRLNIGGLRWRRGKDRPSARCGGAAAMIECWLVVAAPWRR